MNLSTNTLVRTALDHAEGSADRNGEVFDTKGFEGVMMVVKFGDIAGSAVTSIKAQQGAASNLSDAADLEGTGISVADDDDNQIFIIDVYRPRERYVRLVVDKDASHNTEEMAWYQGYGARKEPTEMALDDEVTYKLHVSPAEGTA
jgi:hypothetical protein